MSRRRVDISDRSKAMLAEIASSMGGVKPTEALDIVILAAYERMIEEEIAGEDSVAVMNPIQIQLDRIEGKLDDFLTEL